jgi:hypothetical protein
MSLEELKVELIEKSLNFSYINNFFNFVWVENMSDISFPLFVYSVQLTNVLQ